MAMLITYFQSKVVLSNKCYRCKNMIAKFQDKTIIKRENYTKEHTMVALSDLGKIYVIYKRYVGITPSLRLRRVAHPDRGLSAWPSRWHYPDRPSR